MFYYTLKISSIRNLHIFFTSFIPIINSSSLLLFSRTFKPFKIASTLFSRAHITKGNLKFALYLKK